MRTNWTMICLLMALIAPTMIFGTLLIRILGQCTGGLGGGVNCEYMPNEVSSSTTSISILGWLGLMTWTPFCLVVAFLDFLSMRSERRLNNPLRRFRKTHNHPTRQPRIKLPEIGWLHLIVIPVGVLAIFFLIALWLRYAVGT